MLKHIFLEVKYKLLIAALALGITGCAGKKINTNYQPTSEVSPKADAAVAPTLAASKAPLDSGHANGSDTTTTSTSLEPEAFACATRLIATYVEQNGQTVDRELMGGANGNCIITNPISGDKTPIVRPFGAQANLPQLISSTVSPAIIQAIKTSSLVKFHMIRRSEEYNNTMAVVEYFDYEWVL